MSKPKTSRLEVLRSRYKTEQLADGRGWVAWIEGQQSTLGFKWGPTEIDAMIAMDWFMADNRGSAEFAAMANWD